MKIDTKLKDAIKAFQSFGFEVVKDAEHIKMRNAKGATLSIPHHKRVKGSTLSQLCRVGGIDKKEFFKKV